MKIIAVGCEYVGVSTLLDGLLEWGRERGWMFHMDDHFTIPDRGHLNAAEQAEMIGLSPGLKERFQRLQMGYHFGVLDDYDHSLFGGFHIEEEIYGPRYYYPELQASPAINVEKRLPKECILIHLHARPEVIETRMEADPHEYQVISKEEIPELLDLFLKGYQRSIMRYKMSIDTSDLSGDELLERFLTQVRPLLTVKDLMLLTNS